MFRYIYMCKTYDMSGIIYKIENKVNGKVYIGLTTTSLQTRWNGHKTSARKAMKKEINHPLYNAMAKYGIENFEIKKLDECDNFVKLGELERFYIKEYKSADRGYGYNITRGGERNQLDANPRTKLTVEDIKEIRKAYAECLVGPLELWNKCYKDRISYSAFEKIYEGVTWTTVMPEVYSIGNRTKHKFLNTVPGEKNGNAILTDNEVLEIRKYYVNHSLRECYEKYGEKFTSIKSFRSVIDRAYKNVPRFSKIRNEWFHESTQKRLPNKENVIRMGDCYVEIDTFNDYGDINGTFLTNLEYLPIVREHRWSKFQNGKIYTHVDEKSVKFLHEFIMSGNQGRVYYINGDVSDVRKENLTNNLTECKIMKIGLNKFKDMCLDDKVSLRKIAKCFGISPQAAKKYIIDKNIIISNNKSRK